MSVLLHRESQRIPPGGGTDEDFHFAAAIIVKPLDAPLACFYAILKNLRWFCHAAILLAALTPSSLLPRQQQAGLACWLGRRVRRDGRHSRRIELRKEALEPLHPG
jgi:hypothetical protein